MTGNTECVWLLLGRIVTGTAEFVGLALCSNNIVPADCLVLVLLSILTVSLESVVLILGSIAPNNT